MPDKKRYMQMTVVCLLLSLLSQLVGFCTPSWLHVTFDVYNNEVGRRLKKVDQTFALWYVILCFGETCRTKTYMNLHIERRKYTDYDFGFHSDQDYEDYDFSARNSRFPFSRIVEYEVEASVALVIIFMAYTTARRNRIKYLSYLEGKRSSQPRPRYCLFFCFSLVSGILIMIPTSRFFQINKQLYDISGDPSNSFKLGIPYALICSGIGGILALFGCLASLATMCKSITGSNENRCEAENGSENDDRSGAPQLIPLVPIEPQTSLTGYTDPVMPGYVYNSYQIQTQPVQSDTNQSVDYERRRSGTDDTNIPVGIGLDRNNWGTNETVQRFDQPPPSYDEVMSKYSVYKPPQDMCPRL